MKLGDLGPVNPDGTQPGVIKIEANDQTLAALIGATISNPATVPMVECSLCKERTEDHGIDFTESATCFCGGELKRVVPDGVPVASGTVADLIARPAAADFADAQPGKPFGWAAIVPQDEISRPDLDARFLAQFQPIQQDMIQSFALRFSASDLLADHADRLESDFLIAKLALLASAYFRYIVKAE